MILLGQGLMPAIMIALYITIMNVMPILLRLSPKRDADRRRIRNLLGTFASLVLLSACATSVPKSIQEAPKPALQLNEVRNNPPVGARVRWGGTIAALQHKAQESWLEIVERPLDRDGMPLRGDTSGGRFIARVNGFLEPTVFKDGRLITVSGTISGKETRRIGEYDYDFVVVKTDEYYLWPQQSEHRAAQYYAPYYGPMPYGWYDPWYPWGYYPYWYRHPRYIVP